MGKWPAGEPALLHAFKYYRCAKMRGSCPLRSFLQAGAKGPAPGDEPEPGTDQNDTSSSMPCVCAQREKREGGGGGGDFHSAVFWCLWFIASQPNGPDMNTGPSSFTTSIQPAWLRERGELHYVQPARLAYEDGSVVMSGPFAEWLLGNG